MRKRREERREEREEREEERVEKNMRIKRDLLHEDMDYSFLF